MPWNRQRITSDPDPNSPSPWFEFNLDETGRQVEVTADADAGLAADMTGATLDLSNVNPSEPFRVVITKDGELTTYQVGEDAPPLRAHLSPATTVRDLTLYEFKR